MRRPGGGSSSSSAGIERRQKKWSWSGSRAHATQSAAWSCHAVRRWIASSLMSHVRYEAEGDLGEIVIASPPLNLFGAALFEDLLGRPSRGRATAPRALIVRAEGEVFSAGADVAGVRGARREGGRRVHRAAASITHSVEDLPFPTLAVVGGLCLTAGLELSLACDLLWAAEERASGWSSAWSGSPR